MGSPCRRSGFARKSSASPATSVFRPSPMKPSGRGNCAWPRSTRQSTACWWSWGRPVIRGLSIRRRSSRKSNGRNKPPTAAARSTKGRCGSRFERQFRLERTCAEMMAGAPPAEAHKVEAFYQANRENFRNPGLFRAAHIVRHVGRGRSAEEARVVIEAALAELERGLPFAEVAERYSDCKGNGGEFGQIRPRPNGPAVRGRHPGARTGPAHRYLHYALRLPHRRATRQDACRPGQL